MDLDELFSKNPADPLALLVRQDIDNLSVEELTLRIEALRNEIARAEARIASATAHRANADALFRK